MSYRLRSRLVIHVPIVKKEKNNRKVIERKAPPTFADYISGNIVVSTTNSRYSYERIEQQLKIDFGGIVFTKREGKYSFGYNKCKPKDDKVYYVLMNNCTMETTPRFYKL